MRCICRTLCYKILSGGTNLFGYVQIRKPELKIKDYTVYHGFYCGLCERLRNRYGFIGRLTLTYDMTFMTIFLTSLYDSDNISEKKRCVVHPAKKQTVIYNKYTDYCADMNMLLSYYHCLDDKNDDGSVKGYVGAAIYDKAHRQVARVYRRQAACIKKSLKKLTLVEKNDNSDILEAADCFGKLLAELFCYKKDYFEKQIRKFGYHLGRFVYIMDAFDDIREDIEKERFNPLKKEYLATDDKDCFNRKVYDMLLDEISEACAEFEKLPCVQYIDILRNILYAGVWNKFDKIVNGNEVK